MDRYRFKYMLLREHKTYPRKQDFSMSNKPTSTQKGFSSSPPLSFHSPRDIICTFI